MNQNQRTFQLVKSRFKNLDGEPFELTMGQNEIFDIIFHRLYPRTHCMTYTQYGKSDVCAIATLSRITIMPDFFSIVAPSMKKAGIIMGYIISHIFDNSIMPKQLAIGKDENLERIRRERRKDKLTFRLGGGQIGGVQILTTEGKRVKDVLDAIMGFGSKNVILDESSLVDDIQYAGVKRMLGGHKDNFLFEIGNPFNRNHFLRTFRDPNYHKIVIDWRQGIKEGRVAQEFIDEMKKEAMFGVLYECEFPEQTAIDSKGYSPLLTEMDLDRAYLEDIQLFGEKRLGIDMAGGGRNFSVIVIRADNGAKILYRENNPDTMSVVGIILRFIKEFEVNTQNVFIDKVGIGQGAYDRLREQLSLIQGINFGSTPEQEDKRFLNLRVQSYWRMAEWIKGGAKLKRDEQWEELLEGRYKVQSDGKLKLKTKDEMIQEGIISPDVSDALALTFSRERKLFDENINYYPQQPKPNPAR